MSTDGPHQPTEADILKHVERDRRPGTGRPNLRAPGNRGDSAAEQARALEEARDGDALKAGGRSRTGHHAPDATDSKVPRQTMDLTRVTLSDGKAQRADE